MSEEIDSPRKVAHELLAYARSHAPDSRLLGNVRAADIARVCEFCLGAAEEIIWRDQSIARLRLDVESRRDEADRERLARRDMERRISQVKEP